MGRITSQKKLIEKLDDGYRLEELTTDNLPPKLLYYYITKKDCDEITVAKNVVNKLKEKRLINSDNDYIPNINK